ncbi:hypothetical protein [Streptomyces sp. NPDC056632]|uniref:hypothetical protein n=1 Tax=Streptomyces sp. NPDC056632 TaxID=3345884 RepID=UPI00367E951D
MIAFGESVSGPAVVHEMPKDAKASLRATGHDPKETFVECGGGHLPPGRPSSPWAEKATPIDGPPTTWSGVS